MLALWAVRGREDDGTILSGQPEDDDIEKTADNCPKEQGKEEHES